MSLQGKRQLSVNLTRYLTFLLLKTAFLPVSAWPWLRFSAYKYSTLIFVQSLSLSLANTHFSAVTGAEILDVILEYVVFVSLKVVLGIKKLLWNYIKNTFNSAQGLGWLEHRSVCQNSAGSIPGWGTCGRQ